ncbi:MAG: Xaa-Pro peptidase family protein [Alphaproteobacteria bacterium]
MADILTDMARNTPGAGLKDFEGQVDMRKLRAYRLARTQEMIRAHDLGAVILYDPLNIRYATGSRQMAVWTLHNACRWAFVPAEGLPIIYEFAKGGAMAATGELETVGEVRPSTHGWFYFTASESIPQRVAEWASDVDALVREHCGGNRRIGFDHLDPAGLRAMDRLGIDVEEGERVMERARMIKSAEEVQCMSISIGVAEVGMARMREALKPGLTENELWSYIANTNNEMGGEWMETRILTTGARTNPWMREAGERRVRAGELVSFDTDMIGPFGYCADISRTFFCGPGKPSEEQKDLYKRAVDQVEHNMALLKPGLTFKEFIDKSYKLGNEFAANRYGPIHGVGLADEYPTIPEIQDAHRLSDPDGVVQENMTLCVESYMGREGGTEGVKLEHQVLVTAKGVQLLDTYPWEEDLLG